MPLLPQLVLIGYTNIDINITPSTKTVLPGGGAYFAAIAASRIIKPVGLVTRIGKDYEAEFLLSRVIPDGVKIIPDKLTARSTQIYHSEKDLTDRDIQLEWGVAPDINPEDFPNEWLEKIEIVHISTMPPTQQAKFIHLLRQHAPQSKISLDSDHFFFEDKKLLEQIKENFSKVDIAFANRHEYLVLKETIDQIPEAIVKFDKDGADYLQKGKKIFHIPTKVVAVKDATGAGDMLAGTYLACIVKRESKEKALKLAVEVATESVREVGVKHLFKL